MSIYYDLYLEGLVEDKWTALGPWFKGKDGSFHLGSVMSGKSYVGRMLDDLLCNWGAPKDVSPEVREKLFFADDSSYEKDAEEVEWCLKQAKWFPLSALSNIDPARFEHEAYVPRDLIHSFERGDVDEIFEWLTPEEYGGLPADMKKAYTYYRWTDPDGTYSTKVEFKQRCLNISNMFSDCWMGGYFYNRPTALRCLVRLG